MKTLAERFWFRVNKSGPVPEHKPELGPCWVWTGTLHRTKHEKGARGRLRPSGGRKGKREFAYRVAWFLEHGAYPELLVLHRCDNPECVRIDHLFLGTHQDNMRDMAQKRRAAFGEDSGNAKLTRQQVAEIRAIGDREPRNKVAERYGISGRHVLGIIRGEWRLHG